MCIVFGALGFVVMNHYGNELASSRRDAAQLVRIQTIRTSLVKADANATNAFLLPGSEPPDVRAAYEESIDTAAATVADASSASRSDATTLETVNKALSEYTGLVESARANNHVGFPIGAAYLRQASRTLEESALPQLQDLVNSRVARVNASSSAANASNNVRWLLLGVLVVLLAVQLWLYRRTHRVLNPPLVFATGLVVIIGLVALAVVAWSNTEELNTRKGPYAQTVALATSRINAFDAKSDESLTLILRGSGQAIEASYKSAMSQAKLALCELARFDVTLPPRASVTRRARRL